jgi:hypothetical protein
MKWIIFIEPRYKGTHSLLRNSTTRPACTLGGAHYELCTYVTWRFCLYPYIWQAWICISLSSPHVLSLLYVVIVDLRSIKKKQSKNSRIWPKPKATQSLSWAHSKQRKTTEAYNDVFCLNQRTAKAWVSRGSCAWINFQSQPAKKPAGPKPTSCLTLSTHVSSPLELAEF